MKKYLILYAVITTVVIVFGGRFLLQEQQRHKSNSTALLQSVHHYKTLADESAASVQVLRLRCREFEDLCAADAAKIRQMGVLYFTFFSSFYHTGLTTKCYYGT